jgi:hypothetical protein
MVGLPGQTLYDLAGDIRFFKELNANMIGMGPYITEPDTPVAGEAGAAVVCVLDVEHDAHSVFIYLGASGIALGRRAVAIVGFLLFGYCHVAPTLYLNLFPPFPVLLTPATPQRCGSSCLVTWTRALT